MLLHFLSVCHFSTIGKTYRLAIFISRTIDLVIAIQVSSVDVHGSFRFVHKKNELGIFISLIFSFFLLLYRAKNKMSSRAGGRKRNDLQDYVFNDSDNGTATHQVWKCKGEGCNFEKKVAHGYSMPATRFVVHIVCHC